MFLNLVQTKANDKKQIWNFKIWLMMCKRRPGVVGEHVDILADPRGGKKLRKNLNTFLFENPWSKPWKACKALPVGVRTHTDTLTVSHQGVMNSVCCREGCAEISMTKLPNELVTISFALILSSIINFLSQRRLWLYRSLAARISAFHLTIIPRIKGRPRCANAQACVHAEGCARAKT